MKALLVAMAVVLGLTGIAQAQSAGPLLLEGFDFNQSRWIHLHLRYHTVADCKAGMAEVTAMTGAPTRCVDQGDLHVVVPSN